MLLERYPGMARVLARMSRVEQVLRTFAMTSLPERINGVEVRQLTPRHMDLLVVGRSPFLYKRKAREKYFLLAAAADVAQFLWIVSPLNPLDGSSPPKDFFAGLRPEDPIYFQRFYRAIDRYYDRSTLDQPRGRGGRVVPTALSVSMVHRIAAGYGWLPEVLDDKGRPIPGKGILDMPLARLNQYVMWLSMERDSKMTASSRMTLQAKVAIVNRWHARAEKLGVSVEEAVRMRDVKAPAEPRPREVGTEAEP